MEKDQRFNEEELQQAGIELMRSRTIARAIRTDIEIRGFDWRAIFAIDDVGLSE